MINFINKYHIIIAKISLVIGFIFALFGSLFFNLKLWVDMYYHLMELGFIFYLLAFYILSKNDSKGFSKLWKTITLIIVLCSLSTLVDELFYSAKLVEWNDLIRIIIIVFASFKITYKIKILQLIKSLWKE